MSGSATAGKLPESAVEDDERQEVNGGQHPKDVKHSKGHGDDVAVHILLLGGLPEIAPRLRQGSQVGINYSLTLLTFASR